MKAIIKATGDIIEVARESMIYAENFDKSYSIDEVDILNDEPENRIIPIEPPISYWDQIKHQYAGMAMQGILANPEMMGLEDIDVAATAIRIANITIEKLKEESQCEK